MAEGESADSGSGEASAEATEEKPSGGEGDSGGKSDSAGQGDSADQQQDSGDQHESADQGDTAEHTDTADQGDTGEHTDTAGQDDTGQHTETSGKDGTGDHAEAAYHDTESSGQNTSDQPSNSGRPAGSDGQAADQHASPDQPGAGNPANGSAQPDDSSQGTDRQPASAPPGAADQRGAGDDQSELAQQVNAKAPPPDASSVQHMQDMGNRLGDAQKSMTAVGDHGDQAGRGIGDAWNDNGGQALNQRATSLSGDTRALGERTGTLRQGTDNATLHATNAIAETTDNINKNAGIYDAAKTQLPPAESSLVTQRIAGQVADQNNQLLQRSVNHINNDLAFNSQPPVPTPPPGPPADPSGGLGPANTVAGTATGAILKGANKVYPGEGFKGAGYVAGIAGSLLGAAIDYVGPKKESGKQAIVSNLAGGVGGIVGDLGGGFVATALGGPEAAIPGAIAGGYAGGLFASGLTDSMYEHNGDIGRAIPDGVDNIGNTTKQIGLDSGAILGKVADFFPEAGHALEPAWEQVEEAWRKWTDQ